MSVGSIRDREAVIALSRFGLGARPEDLRIARSDPRGYVLSQLEGPPLEPIAGIASAAQGHVLRSRYQRRDKLEARGEGTAKEHRNRMRRSALEDRKAWLVHTVGARDGYGERLAMFWSNHLAVSRSVRVVDPLRGAYENDVVRPHALGRFRDMVEASSAHPAMLLYLQQAQSFGPNSRAGRKRGRGYNENYARELLELHTLGVDGGYAQSDVTTLALLLTGWGVDSPVRRPERAGRGVFFRARHEPGEHAVLGRIYDGPPRRLRSKVVADLARHPSTARFVSAKLAAAFVGPNPPEPLVQYLERTFRDTEGDLREMARTLAGSDLAWEAPADAFTPPRDWLIALARAMPGGARPGALLRRMKAMGHELWAPPSPAGFKPQGPWWLGPQAMEARVEAAGSVAARTRGIDDASRHAVALFGSALSPRSARTIAQAESVRQGLTLLAMTPEFLRR